MMIDADRLQKLINSILEISAQEKKKSLKDYQVYAVDDFLKKLIEESFQRFRVNKENYIIEGDAKCNIAAVKESLKIVFDNLVDNSIKYSVDLPDIKVRLSCNSHKLIIDYADNGIGIPTKEKKKIFRKFYRINNKEIPNVKGTGLGLYQVRQIIKLHKGKIYLANEGISPGSVFRIELPVFSKQARRMKT